MNPNEVLNFWFGELSPSDWFSKNNSLDHIIKSRFSFFIEAAARGELSYWRSSPLGRLAEIIVLDQFSRNVYRDSAKAFSNDALALILAQEMVILGWDKKIELKKRPFVYMPYMHSESPIIHLEAMRLFKVPGLEENYKFEISHKEVIDRFGRFPHRNKLLNRPSTPEENEFLKDHSGW